MHTKKNKPYPGTKCGVSRVRGSQGWHEKIHKTRRFASSFFTSSLWPFPPRNTTYFVPGYELLFFSMHFSLPFRFSLFVHSQECNCIFSIRVPLCTIPILYHISTCLQLFVSEKPREKFFYLFFSPLFHVPTIFFPNIQLYYATYDNQSEFWLFHRCRNENSYFSLQL